jgi:hypothetical protein
MVCFGTPHMTYAGVESVVAREPTQTQIVVDYATPVGNGVRTSKLAITALIVSLLATPWLFDRLVKLVTMCLPSQYSPPACIDQWASGGFCGATLLSLILGVTALVRIRRSKGLLSGARMAWAALLMPTLWILLDVCLLAVGHFD